MRTDQTASETTWSDPVIEAWQTKTLCPVIGSGLSGDVGIPTWTSLLQSLSDRTLALDPTLRKHVHDKVAGRESGWAYDILSLLKGVGLRGLSRVLYPGRSRVADASWVYEAGFTLSAPALMARLAILVARRAPGRPYHVVSFNQDVILEEAIARMGHRAMALTAQGSSPISWDPQGDHTAWFLRVSSGHPCVTVRVVHPHGLVPRESDRRRQDCVSMSDVILGARSYDRSLGWAFTPHSLWQLAAFESHVCFFYGWSFADVAVRRMLRAALDIRRAAVRLVDEPRHIALMRADRKSDALTEAEDRYLERELGVSVVRTRTYDAQKHLLTMLTDELQGQTTLSALERDAG